MRPFMVKVFNDMQKTEVDIRFTSPTEVISIWDTEDEGYFLLAAKHKEFIYINMNYCLFDSFVEEGQ